MVTALGARASRPQSEHGRLARNRSAGVSPAIVADEDVRAPRGRYSLDGRKLDGKPQKAGLYIHVDRKVVAELDKLNSLQSAE